MAKINYGRIKAMKILAKRYHRYVDSALTDDQLWDEVREGNKSQNNDKSSKVERIRKIAGTKRIHSEKENAISKLAGTIKQVIAKKQRAYSDAKQKIADLVQRFRNGERVSLETEIMDLDSRTQKALKELVGDDLDLKTLSLHLDELKHMEKRHGENGKENQDLKEIQDYEDIIEILNNFDESPKFGDGRSGRKRYSQKYIDKDNKPAPEIEFSKEINNRKRIAVLAINKNKKKRARLITSYDR